MKRERYIFLDIDGVLNSYALSRFAPERNLRTRFMKEFAAYDKVGQELIFRLNKTLPVHERELCPSRIGLVADLCNKYGAKVVLSSSWRFHFHEAMLDEVFHRLNEKWKRGTFVSMTRRDEEVPERRWDLIKEWAHQNTQTPTAQYVVLDDVNTAFPSEDEEYEDPKWCFVLTDSDDAMLYSHYMRISCFFGGK